jgi:hypothetical protein
MKKILVAILILLSSIAIAKDGFNPYVGMAYMNSGYTEMPSPLGIIGVEYRTGTTAVFYEHLSAIPNQNDRGINLVGISQDLYTNKSFKVIGALMFHEQNYDNKGDYAGEINPVMYKIEAAYRGAFVSILNGQPMIGYKITF